MIAELDLSRRKIAEAPIRKLERWQRVISGRIAQGRMLSASHLVVNVAGVDRMVFIWTDEQHRYMRGFVARFARAFTEAAP